MLLHGFLKELGIFESDPNSGGGRCTYRGWSCWATERLGGFPGLLRKGLQNSFPGSSLDTVASLFVDGSPPLPAGARGAGHAQGGGFRACLPPPWSASALGGRLRALQALIGPALYSKLACRGSYPTSLT